MTRGARGRHPRAPRTTRPGRHRAPAPWRPETTYRDGALLLGVSAGIILHAVKDTYALEQYAWTLFFTASLLADAALYFLCAWWWLASTGRAMTL